MFAPYFFGPSRCWGLIESDWLVEGPSPEVFPSICSSKLEVSHACL
jgi:hypothetical protein